MRLTAGDGCASSASLYTARDAAHGRLIPLHRGRRAAADRRPGPDHLLHGPLAGSPRARSSARSARPPAAAWTGSRRALLSLGLKGTIGKGHRSRAVKERCRSTRRCTSAPSAAPGRVLSRYIKTLEIVAYEDLGTEAIRRLEVEDFPAIVINDCHGGDLYQDGMKQYAPGRSRPA